MRTRSPASTGTPAFYVRQPTDTCKGQMYRDFGAGDWFFEVDETSGAQLWSRLGAIHGDPAVASGDPQHLDPPAAQGRHAPRRGVARGARTPISGG